MGCQTREDERFLAEFVVGSSKVCENRTEPSVVEREADTSARTTVRRRPRGLRHHKSIYHRALSSSFLLFSGLDILVE